VRRPRPSPRHRAALAAASEPAFLSPSPPPKSSPPSSKKRKAGTDDEPAASLANILASADAILGRSPKRMRDPFKLKIAKEEEDDESEVVN
jgi:hypothetical protein